MKLEVINCLPKIQSSRPPVLFVHGAFSGAWCWNEYFLPYFAQQGYPAYALSLRGHGNSAGAETLHWTSLADYVADVVAVSQPLSPPPILIGHSMGGMVVQKYLAAGYPATAAVLLAPVPPSGLGASSYYFALTHPLLFWQFNLMHYVSLRFATPQMMKQVLFSDTISDSQVQQYFALMQGESYRVMIDMLWLDLPPPPNFTLPLLVLGAKNDVFFPPSLIEGTAKFYGTQSYLFPQIAHLMMLDTHWQPVAAKILSWLEELYFVSENRQLIDS